MHSAPSVTYPVGRSRFLGMLAAMLWLAGAVAIAFWSFRSDAVGWRHATGFFAVVACGAFAAVAWRRSPAGALGWDGAGWTWHAPGDGRVAQAQAARSAAPPGIGELHVALDLQHHLLVRLHGTAHGARWFWLERERRAERWGDLRRAVYSRARPDALPGAMPPPAKP